MAELFIIEPKKKSQVLKLEGNEFTIGREKGNDLVIPESKVTKYHAKIFKSQGAFFIQDLNSRNGTIVNDQKITKVKLLNNSFIKIGSYKLKFSEGEGDTVMLSSPFMEKNENRGEATLIDEDIPSFNFDERDTVPNYLPEMVQKKDFPRLFIITKSDYGKDFLIDKEEMYIGTDDDADIVIKQAFVSRKHAKLMRLDDDISVIDQKSTNGLFVNGKKVKEKKLYSGDNLSIGQATFRFASRGEVFSPFLENKKKKGINLPVMKIMLILLIVAVLGGAFYGYFLKKQSEIQKQQEIAALIQKDNTLFKEGNDKIKERKWEEAIAKFGKISSKFSKKTEIPLLVEKAKSELLNRKGFYGLLDALEKKDFTKATNLAASFPPDSSYHTEAMKRLSDAKNEALTSMIQQSEQQMNDNSWDAAITTIETALKLDPENEQFLTLLDKAKKEQENSLKQAENLKQASEKKQKYASIRANAWRKYKKTPRIYAKGNVRIALKTLAKIKKMGLAKREKIIRVSAIRFKLITQLNNFYKEGSQLYEQGKIENAIKKWEEFIKYEKKLVKPGNSSFYKEIAPKVSAYYAENADQKYKQKQFPLAYKLWQRAIKIDAANQASQTGLDQLDLKAQELYREAYTAAGYNNITRAKKLWKEVLTIVPSSNKYYKKAQEKLIEYE